MDNGHFYTTIYCQSCGHSHEVPVRCGRRFCPVCSQTMARRAHARISFICNNLKPQGRANWKFITLTLASSDDLNDMVNRLVSGFRKLRARKLWSEAVTGGVYVIEITHGPKGWHAHLHVICIGLYIPQHHLSRVWQSITGSRIVDIRAVKGKSPVGYVTHYLTTFDVTAGDMLEAEAAMKNRRLWSPFGTAHDQNLLYKPQATPCPRCGNIFWISQRAIDRGFAHVSPD